MVVDPLVAQVTNATVNIHANKFLDAQGTKGVAAIREQCGHAVHFIECLVTTVACYYDCPLLLLCSSRTLFHFIN